MQQLQQRAWVEKPENLATAALFNDHLVVCRTNKVGTWLKVNLGCWPDNVGNHDGDIVGSPKFQGFANQELGGLLGWNSGGQNSRHYLGGHHTTQAIAAKHPAITRHGVMNCDVEFWLTLDISQNAHQHAAARVNQSLLLGDSSHVNQALHEGVVDGYLLEFSVSNQIDAGVANVSGDNLATMQKHAREGCSHSLKLWVLLDGGIEHAISLKDASLQGLNGLFDGVVLAVG